jgi:hypothetical protein
MFIKSYPFDAIRRTEYVAQVIFSHALFALYAYVCEYIISQFRLNLTSERQAVALRDKFSVRAHEQVRSCHVPD